MREQSVWGMKKTPQNVIQLEKKKNPFNSKRSSHRLLSGPHKLETIQELKRLINHVICGNANIKKAHLPTGRGLNKARWGGGETVFQESYWRERN